MRLSRLKIALSFVLAAVLSAPAWGAKTALPGTLNYVEGTASIGAQPLDSHAAGEAELQPGQTLNTGNGKAEVLLTPGVFLRIGENSSVSMISPSITDTRITVDKGEAMVEVGQLFEQNDIRIMEHGTATRLLKTGLYDFNADQNQVRVFDGKASVQDGDENVTVKGGHQVSLENGARLKAVKFDKDEYKQADLYRWSSLRSSYLAEANVNVARTYVVNGWYGPGWIGSGWYWNPWFASYTFIPGNGFLYSPFGWGFYSPLWAYRVPVFYGGGFYRHFGPAYRAPVYLHSGQFAARGAMPAFRSAPGSGFRGTPAARTMAPMSSPRGFSGFHGSFHGR